MKKNGFTLIEVLAVIVILALLISLVILVVKPAIEDSKRSSYYASINSMIDSLEEYYFDAKMKGVFTGCSYNFDSSVNSCMGYSFDGKKPSSGFISISSDGVVSGSINVDDYSALVESGKVTLQRYGSKIYDDSSLKDFAYDYIDDVQEFSVPFSGVYKIEAWGASGGSVNNSVGGKGAYTSGEIYLDAFEKLYIYVGENYDGYKSTFSFNGGGSGSYSNHNEKNANGGGATDVRLVSGDWDDSDSLVSRIMVAAGGGGSLSWNNGAIANGGAGGALIGGNGSISGSGSMEPAKGATQTAGGNGANNCSGTFVGIFGSGGYYAKYNSDWINTPGGGGGYYGGGAGCAGSGIVGSAAGGSSYISGYPGCVAIESSDNIIPKTGCEDGTTNLECSYHYSGKIFSNTIMKSGTQNMPNVSGSGSEVGHSGNGYVKISYLRNSSR
jgi:prepilin-type N-terminal cleavage/methylation domain-containing protein